MSNNMGVHENKRVTFIPYVLENPYQESLDKALKGCGFDVFRQSRLRVFASLKNNLSVIHLHWLPGFDRGLSNYLKMYTFCFRLFLLRLCGVKIVWTLHNLFSHDSNAKKREKKLIGMVASIAHCIIIHSPKAKPIFEAEFSKRFSNKLMCIPHGTYVGVYPNNVSGYSARDSLGYKDELVFLFLGNIRPYKGVDSLIQEFANVPAENIRLLIVGKPGDAKLDAQLRLVAAGDHRVRLVFEFVSDDQIQLYMNASDVVVFPYREVLTSGAVILAMSFAKACVVTNKGCMRDVLHEDGGISYSADEPGALSKAIQQTLSFGRERLKNMGANNYQVAKELTWQSIALQTVKAYESK